MASREIHKLDELMDGAVTERFEDEFYKLLSNIFDPNTDAKKAREIHLIFTLRPNKGRTGVDVGFNVKAKHAPPTPIETTFMIDRADDGTITAREHTNRIPGQIDLDGNVELPNVVQFSNPTANQK